MPYTGNVVYNFFDNLLPDNPVIRDRVMSKFGVDVDHPFDILAVIGDDCIGAIQLHQQGHASNVKQLEGDVLSEEQISNLLRGYRENPLGMEDDSDFRISLAGVQEKMALLSVDNQWLKPRKATPTTHILKLPVGVIENPSGNIDLTNSCENEFLCLELLRLAGIDSAESEILTFEDQKVLSVKRFDRRFSSDQSWIIRLPQEDFCQALNLPSSKKYQSDGGPSITDCINLLKNSDAGRDDLVAFMKTQVMFFLMDAIDGHAKNFSIALLAGNTFRMTPIYDVLSLHMIDNKQLRHKARMAMSWQGESGNQYFKMKDIQPRHILTTSSLLGLKDEISSYIEFLYEQAGDINRQLYNVAKSAGIDNALTDRLSTGFTDKLAMVHGHL